MPRALLCLALLCSACVEPVAPTCTKIIEIYPVEVGSPKLDTTVTLLCS